MKTKRPGRVRATILQWLGIPVGLLDADFWSALASSGGYRAGQKVNENTILSLSAAWACTRLISETIATLPLKLYRKTEDGRVSAEDHPLYTILHAQPNADSTAAQYWAPKVAAMLLRGTAFSERLMVGNRLVGLRFLAPQRLRGVMDPNGNVRVRYVEDDGQEREIPEANLFRLPGFSLDGKWGLSVIKYGAGVFGNALAAHAAAASTFEKGLSPTVAFKIDRVIKSEQRDEFREYVKKISGAMNAGESPLLEAGMDAKQIGISPSDAQLIESRGFSVEEICRFFGVDPTLIGHGDKASNWGTGLEQKLRGFLTFTLAPWIVRIQQAVNKDLLTPSERQRGYYAEFALEGLLRADSQARAAYYSQMVNNGIMTRDEVRVLENLPRRGGNADVLTVQTAMAPLDSLGTQSDGARARAALVAWLNEADNGRTPEDS